MDATRLQVPSPSTRVVSTVLNTPGLAGLKPPTARMLPLTVATSSPTRAICTGGRGAHPVGGMTSVLAARRSGGWAGPAAPYGTASAMSSSPQPDSRESDLIIVELLV